MFKFITDNEATQGFSENLSKIYIVQDLQTITEMTFYNSCRTTNDKNMCDTLQITAQISCW